MDLLVGEIEAITSQQLMILSGFFFSLFFLRKNRQVIESKIILVNYLISFVKFNIDPVFQFRGIKDSLENGIDQFVFFLQIQKRRQVEVD